jgi:hypothetical protein
VPIGVLLLVALCAALGGWWAWSFQRKAFILLYPDPDPMLESSPVSTTAPATDGLVVARQGAAEGGDRVVIEQLDRRPASVLGWIQFSVVSVVVMDGVAIVACRSRESDDAQTRRRPWSRSQAQWPLLLTTDQTLVLLMGEDTQAQRARALLERWRRAAAILWLRPTAVAGGIEFYDGNGSALRAMLLAD